ncbi:hypothetical protein O6W96_13465 [Sphingomonas faeni]
MIERKCYGRRDHDHARTGPMAPTMKGGELEQQALAGPRRHADHQARTGRLRHKSADSRLLGCASVCRPPSQPEKHPIAAGLGPTTPVRGLDMDIRKPWIPSVWQQTYRTLLPGRLKAEPEQALDLSAVKPDACTRDIGTPPLKPRQ